MKKHIVGSVALLASSLLIGTSVAHAAYYLSYGTNLSLSSGYAYAYTEANATASISCAVKVIRDGLIYAQHEPVNMTDSYLYVDTSFQLVRDGWLHDFYSVGSHAVDGSKRTSQSAVQSFR